MFLTASPAKLTKRRAASNSDVLVAQPFELEPECAARHRSRVSAELCARRSSEVAADRRTDGRQDLLGGPLQGATDRLSLWRLNELADGLARAVDKVSEKAVEFGFVRDFEQLAGELHLLGLAEHFASLAGRRF